MAFRGALVDRAGAWAENVDRRWKGLKDHGRDPFGLRCFQEQTGGRAYFPTYAAMAHLLGVSFVYEEKDGEPEYTIFARSSRFDHKESGNDERGKFLSKLFYEIGDHKTPSPLDTFLVVSGAIKKYARLPHPLAREERTGGARMSHFICECYPSLRAFDPSAKNEVEFVPFALGGYRSLDAQNSRVTSERQFEPGTNQLVGGACRPARYYTTQQALQDWLAYEGARTPDRHPRYAKSSELPWYDKMQDCISRQNDQSGPNAAI